MPGVWGVRNEAVGSNPAPPPSLGISPYKDNMLSLNSIPSVLFSVQTSKGALQWAGGNYRGAWGKEPSLNLSDRKKNSAFYENPIMQLLLMWRHSQALLTYTFLIWPAHDILLNNNFVFPKFLLYHLGILKMPGKPLLALQSSTRKTLATYSLRF